MSIRDDIRYGFAVGRVRVLEGRLLSRGTFERLLDAPDLREQKRILAETHVGRYLESVETATEVERALEDSLADLYDDFLARAELPAAVVAYFQAPYDYANLRAVVKSRVLGLSPDGLLSRLGTLPPDAFAGDASSLPEDMRSLLSKWDDAEDQPTLDEVEALVDRALFQALTAAAHASKVGFLRDLTRLRINLANARLLVRARGKALSPDEVSARLIPGGSPALEALAGDAPRMTAAALAEAMARKRVLDGISEAHLADVRTFDAAADAVVAQRMMAARRAPGGAEPVLAYVLAREAEVLLLRTVVLGQLAGLDRDSVRAALRERLS